jgi:uncharacterized YkwD family protein
LISKKFGMTIASSVLLLGLAACNNDQGAMENNHNNNGYNTTNRANNDNTFRNVNYNNNNNNDDGIDHNGPLTEDYNNNNRNDNGNRATRTNNNNNNRYNVNNRNNNDNNELFNVNNDNDANRYNRNNNQDRNTILRNNNNANNNNNNNLNISSYKTSLSSKNYPHTRAIVIQEARYRHIPMDQARLRQGRNQQIAQAPNNAQTNQTQNQAPAGQQQQQQAAPAPANVTQAVQQVIDLTNQQRKQNGLPALTADTQLNGVAQKKSADMQQNNYFSHTSPTYGSPFDMMRDFGVTYKTAGENIAQGQRTPQEVVNSWMNSAGHRKNILSRDFTHIGVGYDPTGHHWTQMFIGK